MNDSLSPFAEVVLEITELIRENRLERIAKLRQLGAPEQILEHEDFLLEEANALRDCLLELSCREVEA